MTILDAALEYIKNGFSIIPVNVETKQPVWFELPTDEDGNHIWKPYQSETASEDQVRNWFTGKNYGIALIAGKVSGNLEVLDFDNHFGDAEIIFNEFSEIADNSVEDILNDLPVTQTQSGGRHLLYRCSEIKGNQKLASRTNNDGRSETLIETRGEGGYFIVPPTPGYKTLNLSTLKVPEISPEDRNCLIDTAKSFHEAKDNVVNYTYETPAVNGSTGARPGDEYNRRADHKTILERIGWQLLKQYSTGREIWRRPGKPRGGPSATFNFVKDKFFVFSTNAHPFESNRSYDKFALYTVLEHQGDFNTAAKTLLTQGYGSKINGKSKGINGVKSNPDKPTLYNSDDIFESLNLPVECVFWYEVVTGGKKNPDIKLQFKKSLLINFLEHHGIFKYWLDTNLSTYVKVENNIVTEETPETIADYLKELILKFPNQISQNFLKEDLWEMLLQKINVIKSKDFLETLTPKRLKFIVDSKKKAFFFYKNCIVKVTDKSASTISYNEINGYIWKDQIVDHNIELLPAEIASDTSSCQFGQFLERAASPKNPSFPNDRSKREIDVNRLSALCSTIGYMLHTYMDPSVTKAIIFCEEKIAKDDDSNGRTGKGLTAYAIGKLRKRVLFNGKQVDFKDKFLFQKISPDTQFIYFDDVKKNFDFEMLFSVLTEGITIERKGQAPIDIPFDKSPKILISTNNVLSNDSDSHRARKFELEFSDYFSADYTPVDEFETNFFEKGWKPDDPEWNKFYSFMMYCTMHYLKMGLVDYAQSNLEERKLMAKVPEEFLEFANDEIDRLLAGEKIYKDDLYETFVNKHKIYGPNGKYAKTQKATTVWFNNVVDYRKIEVAENKGSSREDRRKYWELAQNDDVSNKLSDTWG